MATDLSKIPLSRKNLQLITRRIFVYILLVEPGRRRARQIKNVCTNNFLPVVIVQLLYNLGKIDHRTWKVFVVSRGRGLSQRSQRLVL